MISVTDVNIETENSPVSSFPNLNSSTLSTVDYSRTNESVYRHEEFIEIFEVPVGIVAFLSVCYGAVSLVAVIGNACVLWVVASRRRMRTVTNYFISNLALADIVIGLFAVPFQFQAALLQKWLLPAFLCAFCPFVQVLSVNVSVFTLTAIAFDRYRAVLHPLKKRGTSKLSAKLTILGIWLVGGIAAAPYIAAFRVTSVFNPDTGDYTKPFCTNTRISPTVWGIYNYLLATLQYALPLCLISFAYGRMALRLRGNGGFITAPRDEVILKNKKKVIKMLAIVVALFAVCWLPFQTYNVLQEVLPQINDATQTIFEEKATSYKYINVIWFSAHWLAMSNSCYNPFIYAIYNDHFKLEFEAQLCCREQRQRPVFESDTMLFSLPSSSALQRNRLLDNVVGELEKYLQEEEVRPSRREHGS